MRNWLANILTGLTLVLCVHWFADGGKRRASAPLSVHSPGTPQSTENAVPDWSGGGLVNQVSGSEIEPEPLVAPIRVVGRPPNVNPHISIGDWQQLLLSNFVNGQFHHDPQAAFHAHGVQVCASGCAVSNHPTQELTKTAFRQLMAECAAGPLDESNRAFETLLFYGRQTRKLLETHGFGPLNSDQAGTLRRELTRTHVRIAVRVTDEHGEIRSSLRPTRVPFDRRHVFDMDVHRLQPLVTSGMVKRVGLQHMWTRL